VTSSLAYALFVAANEKCDFEGFGRRAAPRSFTGCLRPDNVLRDVLLSPPGSIFERHNFHTEPFHKAVRSQQVVDPEKR
jgi:hypothetical protein